MLWRLAPLVAVAAFASGCGSSGGRTIDVSKAGKLVLATNDLPRAFEQFYVGPQVGLDNAGTPRANPTRYGRERGWVARYHRSGGKSTRGPLVVESRADLFRDAGGARKDLAAYETELRSTPGAKPISVPRIGDAAVGATISRAGPLPVVFYVIAWRDRNATASVNVNGFSGKIRLADALALARKQERRISDQ